MTNALWTPYLSFAACCALLAPAYSCSPERAIPVPSRVLLVVTDATHAAHLSCYGGTEALTPSIDAIAVSGVRFSRAFSNNTWTLASTASLLTGKLQEFHGAVTNHHRLSEDATTAAEYFKRAGWTTAAFVQMAYASAKFGFDQGFDSFLYYGKGQPGRAGQTIPDTLGWLEEQRDNSWFLYLHLRRPHSPYKPNPGILKRLDVACELANGERNEEFEFADSFGRRELSPGERAHVEHLYRANLATTDALLAKVFDRARERDALIVVTSDHGEALGQHGFFGHGAELWSESIDIPLIFWWPSAVPRVDDQPASTVDVLPTLLELCELPIEAYANLNGQSLYPRLTPLYTPGDGQPITGPVFASGRYTWDKQPKIAVIEGDWKLIFDPDGTVELFNRRNDPGDTTDLSDTESERTKRLSKLAADQHRQAKGLLEGGTHHDGLEPALSEDLRALGYGE